MCTGLMRSEPSDCPASCSALANRLPKAAPLATRSRHSTLCAVTKLAQKTEYCRACAYACACAYVRVHLHGAYTVGVPS